jgi:hypothetical protein
MNTRAVGIGTAMLFMLLASGAPAESSSEGHAEGLDFPVVNVADLDNYYCFGLQPWDTEGADEIHDGIDLVARYSPGSPSIGRVAIVAPADARVARIVESVSGAGASEVIVVLEMNKYWYMAFTFEPQTADPAIFEEQRRSIAIREKQKVKRGDPIGELVVAGVEPGSYPHVHFSFLYKHPDDTLEYLFENFLLVRRSDGTDLAPTAGPGSPWKPRDLGRETTLYCPYEYSTPEARAAYDSLPRLAATGDTCRCICAYGSTGGDCGNCGSI